MNFLEKIKKDYVEVSDLVVKTINTVNLVYLETLADQDKINDYILKIIPKSKIPKNIKNLIPSPNVKDVKTYE